MLWNMLFYFTSIWNRCKTFVAFIIWSWYISLHVRFDFLFASGYIQLWGQFLARGIKRQYAACNHWFVLSSKSHNFFKSYVSEDNCIHKRVSMRLQRKQKYAKNVIPEIISSCVSLRLLNTRSIFVRSGSSVTIHSQFLYSELKKIANKGSFW